MKILIDGGSIRVKGNICGEKRHIKIYCGELNGKDYYSFSIVKDGAEHACLPSVIIDKDFVIIQSVEGKEIL